jgi:hypothetical protein
VGKIGHEHLGKRISNNPYIWWIFFNMAYMANYVFLFKTYLGEICENNVQKQDNEHKSLYQRQNVELGNCNFTW